jgi:hypothetical protein
VAEAVTKEELIARLEAATKADWELDGYICEAVRAVKPEATPHWDWPLLYTASIDAALTLVPETDGKRWYEIGQGWSQAVARVRVYPPSPWEGRTRDASAEAANPAIALCIAALKARA